jgi:hypothetical protein
VAGDDIDREILDWPPLPFISNKATLEDTLQASEIADSGLASPGAALLNPPALVLSVLQLVCDDDDFAGTSCCYSIGPCRWLYHQKTLAIWVNVIWSA